VRFSDPYWLLAGLLTGIALVGAWRWHDAWQRSALAAFVASHLRLKLTGSVSRFGRLMQRGLFLVSMLCLFAALAGPELGYHWELISRRGNEVVFAIDTSRSMLTPDVTPNRLTRAKLAIDDMARQLDGDGIGIVAFAGRAFAVCPLTLDYGAFHQSLDAIDVRTIPLGGTNIPNAIAAARATFRRRASGDRILILVTDGENLEGDALAAAKAAATQDGLKIYTVGIGTAAGELIPLPPDLGGGFVKDETGAPVKSHLDESGLKAIASATGGTYVRLEGEGETFDAFLRTVFGAVSKHDLIYRQQKVYTQRYQWPLTASLVMLLGSLLVGTRRASRRRTVAVSGAVAVPTLLALMIIPMRSQSADLTGPTPATRPDSNTPILEYNAGTAAYRAGQFPQATRSFQQSIDTAPASDAKRLADQEDAYYNLGNALYRAGQRFEKSNPQEAIRQWTDALKAYDTALQLRRDDGDSQYNRDFVQKRIDALQQPPDQGGGGGGGGGGRGAGNGDGKGGGQPPSDGQGKGQPPPQGQGQSKGQPPPQGRGQPQGQPPPQGQGQSQGQPPPQGQGQSQGQPPPQDQGQSQGQPPPQVQLAQAAAQNSGSGSPPPAQQAGPSANAVAGAEAGGAPGQMSAEDARALLDSAKSEERHSLPVPSGPRDPDQPDKPFKNW
jgi:Ca-activated chloride channel homolog